ncbi:MAG: S53 family peptidase, partial [Candidatus Dormibacteraeota bacterium]|nr:S53 family peptidase [Candidatus Dormibacteraeota bacterium]MBO0761796.1 S53 family peptidase [Candidatus Dormibacteraeota bacterium]
MVLLVGAALGVRAGPARAAGPPGIHHPLKLGPAAPRPYSPSALPSVQFSSPSQGYIPCDLANAYGLRNLPEQGQGVTIGIPDAYDQPNLEADLHQFDATFGIPDPPSLNVIRQRPFNGSDQGWQLETSMDVEYAHALAPKANIVVVLAPDAGSLWDSLPALVQNGADLVSMSWGAPEFEGEGSLTPPQGPLYAAASGDAGQGTSWPAALPQVASVGGTAVSSAATGHDTSGHTSCTNGGQPVTSATQTAWSGSGGGVSTQLGQPTYQQGVVSAYSQTRRVQNDTALDADPSTGVTVYDSAGFNQGVCNGAPGNYNGCTGFLPFAVGGTSLATPLLAGSLAVLDEYRVAHGAAKVSSPADLYTLHGANANDFSDVAAGNNGSCGLVCNAAAGYDSVTGLGSPLVAAMEGTAAATCAQGGTQLTPVGGIDSLGGFTPTSVAAASWDRASRQDVFVRGGDGSLWHAYTNGGPYIGW